VASCGVSDFMVRNFGILKILFFRPTLSDQYSAGPFDVTFIAKTTNNIGIANKIISNNPTVISKIIFTHDLDQREFQD
jgi:hypothetical protein